MNKHTGTFVNLQDIVDYMNKQYLTLIKVLMCEDTVEERLAMCKGKMVELENLALELSLNGTPGQWRIEQ